MENKNYQKYYLFAIILLVFIIIWMLGNNTAKNDNIKIYKNNIEALSNELDSFRLKNNELVVTKQNLILEIGVFYLLGIICSFLQNILFGIR